MLRRNKFKTASAAAHHAAVFHKASALKTHQGGAFYMAKCDICSKGVSFGIKVSHSHRRSNKTWKPNVMRVKAIVNGKPCHIHVCSRCLRSGKVTRAI